MNIKDLRKVLVSAGEEYKARVGLNPNLTGCVLATCIASERLAGTEVELECLLGQASFGFNKGDDGCLDYGYSIPDAKASLARLAEGSVRIRDLPHLPGHAWVEVGDYVVDLTLLTLKSTIRQDDQVRGTRSGPFKIDLGTAPVIHRTRLVSRAHIKEGGIGVHYCPRHRLSRQSFLELI